MFLEIYCTFVIKRLDKLFFWLIILENLEQKWVKKLSTVRVGETENVENAIKRFKRKCQKDGVIGDLRKHEQYEKPSVKRKKKQKAAIKRNKKRA